jgi:polyisoprenoid-binding protein YceI
LTTAQTATSTWTIDPAHSAAEFAVKHLMISTVKGQFTEFEGMLQIDEGNPENSSVVASIDVASVNTNQADRDAHLRSDDFFNAEKYPKMTFRSKSVRHVEGDLWKVSGDLTIRDVTREVVLDTRYEGRVVDPWGNERAAFTAETTISRKEFNVRWNQVIEAGGVAVGDSLRVTLNIEVIRQK